MGLSDLRQKISRRFSCTKEGSDDCSPEINFANHMIIPSYNPYDRIGAQTIPYSHPDQQYTSNHSSYTSDVVGEAARPAEKHWAPWQPMEPFTTPNPHSHPSKNTQAPILEMTEEDGITQEEEERERERERERKAEEIRHYVRDYIMRTGKDGRGYGSAGWGS